MTQTPNTFQNLTDEQIEEIIAKVEASKPWSGYLRSIEMFLAKFHTRTIFTAHGLHLVMAYLIIKIFDKTTVLSQESFYQILYYFSIVPVFSLVDIYFAFFPSKFDKMSIRDWTLAILKQQDFNQSKTHDIFKYSLYFYIPFSIFIHFIYQNIYASLLTYSLYSIFLTALYLGTDTILFFKSKIFWMRLSTYFHYRDFFTRYMIYLFTFLIMVFAIDVLYLSDIFIRGMKYYEYIFSYMLFYILIIRKDFDLYAHYRGIKIYYIASALSDLSRNDNRLRNLFYYN
jgi:hypothetical protein